MNNPLSARPFPIPVLADLGPGSQEDDEALDYPVLPSGMRTYQPPRLPEPEALAGHAAAVAALAQVLQALREAATGGRPAPVSLAGLPDADLALIHQVLGEGEVSAQVLAEAGRGSVQIQESVFAGVWRVLAQGADGSVADHIEVAPVPAALLQAAVEDGLGPAIETLPVPPGVVNAPALLVELQDQQRCWLPGQPPHVVNLTLLPLSAQDIAWLDHHLGTGRVLMLSRGYGNCRITSTRVPHTWRVVYYNSQDAVILNAVEVATIPEVACAAPEDLADSGERLHEVLQWVAQG